MSEPYIITLGCRLNAYESDRMRLLAEARALKNITIINSCAVTHSAVRQSRQAVRRAKKERPDNKIYVAGCAANIESTDIAKMKEVDGIINPPNRFALEAETMAKQARTRAMLKIQDGCDWRCTFCIIPQGRGASCSRAMPDIISEANILFEDGHLEMTLTGVDITSYGKDLPDQPKLGDLVEGLLLATPSRLKFRLTSLDPAAIDEKLFTLLASEKRLQPHIHLSAQAGDDMILKRMRRRHSRAQMVRLCNDLQKKRALTIGADLIAGFPTETTAMFENSLNLIADCDIVFGHIFPFSARPETPAARMPQLSAAIIRARALALRTATATRLHHFLDGQIGDTESILAETEATGRTDSYARVRWQKKITRGITHPMKLIAREADWLVAIPL